MLSLQPAPLQCSFVWRQKNSQQQLAFVGGIWGAEAWVLHWFFNDYQKPGRKRKHCLGKAADRGVVFSLCRDSLSLITLMTVAIETSRCAQLKFVSQSFQPCPWRMAPEVRELLFILERRSRHLAKSWVSSICGSLGALWQRRDGAKKRLTQNRKNKTKPKHHHARSTDNLQEMTSPKKAKGLQVFTPGSGSSKRLLSLLFLGSVRIAPGMSSSVLGSSDSAFFWRI